MVFLAFLPGIVIGQTLSINNRSTPYVVSGTWTDPTEIVFTNMITPYANPYSYTYGGVTSARGLQFQNGLTNQVYANIRNLNENEMESHSPLVCLSGPNTQVVYHGRMTADTYLTKAYFGLTNGSKFTFAADAYVDLVQDAGTSITAAYWTRQLWVYGDGTGTIEMAPGFVCDHTQNGTVTEGLGSIRLSNTTWITNSSQNIPLGYRPINYGGGGGTGPNGHVVFENAAGGTWRVQTNDQSSISAFWAYVNCNVDTQTNLTHSGTTVVFSDGTMQNAFQTVNQNVTITKKGPAALNLNGEVAFNVGGAMDIQQGTVNYNTDPAAGAGKGFTNAQNLTVNAMNTGTANFNATLSRIKALSISDSGVARVASGKTLNLLSAATLNGGTLTGGGTLSGGVNNTAGNVNPGDISAKGTLAITGAYSQGASGKFTAEISSAGCDALSVSGAATLAGTIDSSLLGGFTPAAGTSYDVLTAGSISGTFSNAGVNIAGGYLKANYTATKVSLLALRQGDSNGDKAVDVVDLGLLATGYGTASGATWQMGDYNHDGTVNVIDLGLLATNYGTTYGSTGDVVPEPVSAVVLVLGGLVMLNNRKQK